MVAQWDLSSTNITCGRLAFDYAENTEIADVAAGTEIGFTLGLPYETVSGRSESRTLCID